MRILIINTVCGIRSTGRICTDLAEAFENQGHRTLIGYGRESVPESIKCKTYKIDKDIDVKTHAILARAVDGDGRGSIIATKRFISRIDQFNPDVVHLHNIHGYYINHKILFDYLKETRKKVVWTFHDIWPMTGHGCICEGIKCKKWETGCGNCPGKKNYPETIIDRSKENYRRKRKLFNSIENLTIVTPSNWLAGLVKCSYLKDHKIEVIPNGIDTDVFKRTASDVKTRYNIEGKKLLLGCATWWTQGKGIKDFYKMAKLLNSEYVIMLVGLSKEQIIQLPENIIGIQRTNDVRELVNLYSAADLFINPTYIDNYPTVNLEALACDTPVITYKTGGSAECLNGNNGKAFEQGDIRGIVDFLNSKYHDGYFHVESNNALSKKTFCDRYIGIYSN